MILVTGGTGLLGAHLLLDLAKAGRRVRALRRPSSSLYVFNLLFSPHPELLNNIEWIDGDVLDIYSITEAMQGVNEVYHCAAKVSFQPADYELMMKANVEGTANMVNVALQGGVKKFCHVSSVSALGRLENEEYFDEQTYWKSSKEHSGYAVSKYGAEQEVWRAMEEGLQAVIANPTIIIGAGNWKSGSSQMFSEVWRGMPFYTSGTGGFVDAHDVTGCMIQLMDKDISGERFIINSENLPYREVMNHIASLLGKRQHYIRAGGILTELAWRGEALRRMLTGREPLITKETARHSHYKWNYSNTKIKERLKWNFLPVEESLQRTAVVFLKERANGH